MKSFWMVVNRVLKECDVLVLVLDARFPELCLHPELEDKAKGRPIIYVLNKCDLANKERLLKWKRKLKHCIFVSTRKHFGITMLKHKVLELAQGKPIRIGVFGYPNTGKSSLINALKGRKSAGTSPQSGHTKGVQMIRIAKGIMLLDTPGVLPYREDDQKKLALINAVDYSKVKDPDLIVMDLLKEKGKLICSFYGVDQKEDPEEILESVAEKLKKFRKGRTLDLDTTSRIILRDWQRGKITMNH
jgi:ribosome biogenesis GTPase A